MTIVDLMTKSDSNISLNYINARMRYRRFDERWVISQYNYGINGAEEIFETESESKAVAAFCEAAGIEVTE